MPWFWDLVAMLSQIPLCLPNLHNLLTQKYAKPKPSCLALRASAIKEQSFSKAVATRIEAHQRVSTRSVYGTNWTILQWYSHSNQVDFRAPPIKSTADFLLYLFKDRTFVMVKNLNENVELLIIFKFHETQAKCLSKLTLFGQSIVT